MKCGYLSRSFDLWILYERREKMRKKNKSIEMGLDPTSLSSFFTFRIVCILFGFLSFSLGTSLFLSFAFRFRFIRFWMWIKGERSSDNPQRWVNRHGDSVWLVWWRWREKWIVWVNRSGVERAIVETIAHCVPFRVHEPHRICAAVRCSYPEW